MKAPWTVGQTELYSAWKPGYLQLNCRSREPKSWTEAQKIHNMTKHLVISANVESHPSTVWGSPSEISTSFRGKSRIFHEVFSSSMKLHYKLQELHFQPMFLPRHFSGRGGVAAVLGGLPDDWAVHPVSGADASLLTVFSPTGSYSLHYCTTAPSLSLLTQLRTHKPDSLFRFTLRVVGANSTRLQWHHPGCC